MTTRWFSLRRRLLGLLLGGLAIGWLTMVAFSYLDAHQEIDELFDAQLAQAAQTLLAMADPAQHATIDPPGAIAHKYQRGLRFQIWRADGVLLLRSDNAPNGPLTDTDGFSATDQGDGHWRHYSQWDARHQLQVQVSENHRLRDELIGQIAWRLILPALFGLPLIGLGIWLATRRGLASLDDVADQIARRDPQQLQAVHPSAAPAEIRCLLEALNQLFTRVEGALEAERRFTADAAHELRTPLAALQAQLQVALRARNDAERQHSLSQLQSGLSRASHLVDQMLQLARLDPESALPNPVTVDLGLLAQSVCAELGMQILDKQLDFELMADEDCVVAGQADWLRILIRNLVDNAVRYTPPGGRVVIRLERISAQCLLRIEDSGPGIPPDKRDQALRRFHRLNPAAESGSGLGLAIVSRIAELHGTRLHLSGEPGHGLRVDITFPGQPG
ncbi:MAG: ATP-binding protein [Azonexus sp.]|nr:ATP-binding protein [Azonexus sp.]